MGLSLIPGRAEAGELGLNGEGGADGGSNGFSGFQSIARDVGHGGFGGIDAALLHQLFQHGNGGSTGRFRENAFRFSQQLDPLDDLLIGNGSDTAAGAICDVDGVGAIRRIANGDGFGNGVGFDGLDEIPALLEGLGDGRTSLAWAPLKRTGFSSTRPT